jgi:hypothetical protein
MTSTTCQLAVLSIIHVQLSQLIRVLRSYAKPSSPSLHHIIAFKSPIMSLSQLPALTLMQQQQTALNRHEHLSATAPVAHIPLDRRPKDPNK